jgi:hypothetical protein
MVSPPIRREDDVASIGRPARVFVAALGGQEPHLRSVRVDHHDLKLSLSCLRLARTG